MEKKKVYLFATCLATAAMGRTIQNVITLLEREGVEVIFKKNQSCCGQPAFNTGYFEETKKLAVYNAKMFDEDYPVLVPSGSCAGVMAHEYLDLFKEDDENYELIKNFSDRVMELGVYLADVLKVKYEDKGEPLNITWHSNCHATRIMKSIEAGKSLVAQLKNVNLIELEDEEECCGFGGTFSVKEPEISNAMATNKVNDIIQTGCKVIVTADGGCLMNIAGTMKRQHKEENIKVVHLYDFLLKRINGEEL